MAKRSSSVRFSDLTTVQLEKLGAHFGLTQTEVIAVAVDRLYVAEGLHIPKKPPSPTLFDIVQDLKE